MRHLFISRRRELPAATVFLAIGGSGQFFFITAFTLAAVYRIREADLNAFQLVILGTALEGAVLLFEVPTGVVADVYSRRLSVVIGYALVGAGIALEGLVPRFESILLAQAIWGIGYTFTSGAEAAWIADEVGEETAARLYVRRAQLEQVGSLIGIGTGVALATVRLNLPLVVGGALFVGLALFLALTMPEHGFRPAPRSDRGPWATASATFRSGLISVRTHPILLTIFAITAIGGAASEAFDRLWELHFLEHVGFPDAGGISDLVWFGFLDVVSFAIGIAATEIVRRRLAAGRPRSPAVLLLPLTTALIAASLIFALAPGFWVAAGSYWTVLILRRLNDPLQIAWVNRGLEPRVRATVLSMRSQSDAVGQVAGGPLLGALAVATSVRAALVAAGLVLAPAIVLYVRALRRHETGPPTS